MLHSFFFLPPFFLFSFVSFLHSHFSFIFLSFVSLSFYNYLWMMWPVSLAVCMGWSEIWLWSKFRLDDRWNGRKAGNINWNIHSLWICISFSFFMYVSSHTTNRPKNIFGHETYLVCINFSIMQITELTVRPQHFWMSSSLHQKKKKKKTYRDSTVDILGFVIGSVYCIIFQLFKIAESRFIYIW